MDYPDRRQALIAGATWLAGAVAGGEAWNQSGGRLPFGVRLPPAVEALIPGAPMEAARIVEQLLALEDEAERLRLPRSDLSLDAILALPLDTEALYALALPRLVTLIDRAERRNFPFAERAGALLAQLHSSEHRTPDGLVLPQAAISSGKAPRRRMALMQHSAPVPPVNQTLPPLPRPVEPPVIAADQDSLPAVINVPDEGTPELPDSPERPEVVAPDRMQRSIRYADLRDEYRALFLTAELRPDRAAMAQWHGAALRRARPRYEAVAARVDVPWYFIGTIHALEASFNFRAHLHNGDFPLSTRTRQVPAGRPLRWLPPSDWESSAIDAMRLMGFSGQSDWSLERTLHRLEAYNGFGYRRLGVPTPYLWSFSGHYDRGKFVADGRFSSTARSQQCGAAVMLKLLAGEDGVDLGT
jgi:lysozyme family protein